jgi:hypothetical protein
MKIGTGCSRRIWDEVKLGSLLVETVRRNERGELPIGGGGWRSGCRRVSDETASTESLSWKRKCIGRVRFQVLTAASPMFRAVFWVVLPCEIRGWWRQYAPLKRRSTIILHGCIPQKTALNTVSDVLEATKDQNMHWAHSASLKAKDQNMHWAHSAGLKAKDQNMHSAHSAGLKAKDQNMHSAHSAGLKAKDQNMHWAHSAGLKAKASHLSHSTASTPSH